MQSGYNILVPDICRDAMPEVTLPVMDALQALGHTPVVLSMLATSEMYQEYRYAKHGCYEIFLFYYKDLLRQHRIDFGFSTGLLGILEDLSKSETHNLLEEAGIPNLLYLHCRDGLAVARLIGMGAAQWRHTHVACSSPELATVLREAGVARAAYSPPATSLRLFYPATAADAGKPYAVLSEDSRLAGDFEVSFAGSWSAEREELLFPLLECGIKLAVFGDAAWSDCRLAGVYRGKANYLTELNTVYNASRVVLDLPHPDCRLPSYISGRVVDAMAAGSLVITYERQVDLPFPAPGAEAVTFGGDGLVEAVRNYLTNDVERHRIATRNREAVEQAGTWGGRLAGLLPRLELQSLRAS